MNLEPRRKITENGFLWAVLDKDNNSWFSEITDYTCKKDCLYAIRYLMKEGHLK